MNGLERIAKDPSLVRDFCIGNGISAYDFFAGLSGKKIEIIEPVDIRPTHPPVSSLAVSEETEEDVGEMIRSWSKKVPDRYAVAVSVLADFRNRNGRVYDFGEFVESFNEECNRAGVELDSGTPVAGQAAYELYQIALKDRGRNAAVVFEGELEKSLGVKFDGEKQIVGKLDSRYVQENYPIVNGHIVHENGSGIVVHPKIEGVENWSGEMKQIVREDFSDFVDRELFSKTGKRSLRYFGLEGPNFRSYRELLGAAKGRGLTFPGLFVERDGKLYNLMRSVAHAHGDEFRGSYMLKGDVNDLIMLDFVKDRRMRLSNRGDNGVVYMDERISMEQYDRIINRAEKGSSARQISERYDVSREFAQVIGDRFIGKFDVVFLDYMGEMDDNRAIVLETLAKRRLNDQAVVAFTYDVDPRFLKKRNLTSEQAQEAVMGSVKRIFSNQGYEVLGKPVSELYQDSHDEMCFQAYSIRRENDRRAS